MAAVSALHPDILDSEREILLKNLLDAVKQCQVQFGGKRELATDKHSCVQCLLTQFERAFIHGLRRGKVWTAISSLSEPFRNVTSKVLSGIPDVEISFWPFIKEHMSSSEVQRYFSLNSINTDSGRCRSWLRSCLNEASLERMLLSILADPKLIRQFYEDSALFLDEERSSTLPAMARGLRSILFAVNIDSSQLNSPFKQPSLPRENAALAPMESNNKNNSKYAIPNQAPDDPSIINKKKRKKKVKQATIEDIEFPEDEPPSEMYLKPGLQNVITSTVSKKISDKTDKAADFSTSVNARRTLPEEAKPAMTHRRATSLESSEIIMQKQDRRRKTLDNHIDCEVTPSGSPAVDAKKTDRRNEAVNKQANELKNNETDRSFDMNEEVDSKEDPEYSNILSKLANISTSFKSSLSMGFFQRDQQRKGDAVSDQHDDDEYKDLLDDDNDVISRTSKLEMQEDLNESRNNEENRQFYKNHTSDKDGENVSNNENVMCTLHSTGEETSRVAEIETPLPTNKDSDIWMKENDELHAIAALNGKPNILAADGIRTGGEISKTTHPIIAERVKEMENCSIVDDSKMATNNQDDIDRLSVNSSNAGSASYDSDTMQPVGFASEKFLSMSYDIQSSKAANDALQLLKTSVDISFLDNGYSGERNDQYKSLPKQYTSSMTTDSSYVGDLSKEELKEAILATVKRKDEFEEQNRVLQLALDEERECSLSLKAEVEALSEKIGELQETSKRQTDTLSRENEILRNQLKQYVAAVQLLKRESRNMSTETNDAIGTLRGYSDDSEVILPPQLRERVDSEMDSIYEEKLIQMSQLHGELMEFHEMLQRNLVKKEKIMTQMKEELVCLRGPLPDEIDDSNEDCEREHRPLINVWIPSVFTQGTGSDAHHLYQIYIRIGDEEWNIYRRYSQFHRLHILSSKTFQGVDSLNFPPKKIIGKKDLKFVEGRRKKLQNYLRKLINISLANDRLLSGSPCKENLENSLPFFSDETYSDGKKRKESKKKKSKTSAVYTGL